MDYPRREIRQHVLAKDNICLLTSRQQADAGFSHVFMTKHPAESCAVSNKTKEKNYVFPLYLYPAAQREEAPQLITEVESWPADAANGGRVPNISRAFIADVQRATGLLFEPISNERGRARFGAENVFHYVYAILHSGNYRETYSQFLKMDFPRIPLPKSQNEFLTLADLGRRLQSLHLLDGDAPQAVRFPVAGGNLPARSYPHFRRGHLSVVGRVYINETQYFDSSQPASLQFHRGRQQLLSQCFKEHPR